MIFTSLFYTKVRSYVAPTHMTDHWPVDILQYYNHLMDWLISRTSYFLHS